MRILLTADSYLPAKNGVVTSLLHLREGLTALGHEVRILTLSDHHHTYYEDGVWYLRSVSLGPMYPGLRFRDTLGKHSLNDLIRWNPDVVHSQSEFSTFSLARRIANTVGAPFIHTYHTLYEDYTSYFFPSRRGGRALAQRFSRYVLSHTDAVIAPTEKIRTLLKTYGVQVPIEVIPTGINIERFSERNPQVVQALKSRYGIKDDDFVLLYLGRLATEKSIDELIRFFPEDGSHITLLIVGDGPEQGELESLVASRGLQDRVIFAGAQDYEVIPLFYQLGNLFCSASRSETQGLTYVEALASGLPVLGRADSCIDGLVQDGVNGWQFTGREEFVRYIDLLSHDGSLQSQMSCNARDSSTPYSRETFARTVESLYITQWSRKNMQKNWSA